MTTEPAIHIASQLVDSLDWVTPTEVLEHLGIPEEGLLGQRIYAATDTSTGRVIEVCSTAIEVDILDHLIATHATEPPVAGVVPVRCRPDLQPSGQTWFRTRQLFGDRTGPEVA